MRISRTLPFALGLVAVGVSQAQAQTANDEIYELITTAIHTHSTETALPVTVLSGDALHEAARATLGDTLGSQPGIQNASFGPAVGQTVVRGQQGRRVMNLTNGLPNADASGNSADHAQTVEAILANSIEVLRGPSTLLYGGGAIGGVVNVIDGRIANTIPDAPSLAVETRHDTAADLSTTVGNLNFATGNLVWHFDGLYRDWNDLEVPGLAIDPRYLEEHEHEGEHEEDGHEHEGENSDGFIANTGGRGNSATGGVSWVFDNGGHLGFAYSKLENRYGLPPGAHEHEEPAGEGAEEHVEEAPGADFVHIEMERERYDVDGEWLNLASWAQTLSYKASYTDYAHSEIEGNGDIGTQFSNESWQQRLQLTHTDTEERHGVVGLQRGDETFSALGEESFIPVTDITSTGLFVVEDFHLMATTFEVGGRINRDDYKPQDGAAPARDFDTYSLSGSALWDMTDTATLGLSVSRSQRAPSVEELYSNYGLANLDDCVIHEASGSCEVGDIGFSEETSLNTDLTLALNYDRFNASITGFYNSFNDYIGQVATGESVAGSPVRAYTQDDARFYGLEMDADFKLTDNYNLSVFGDLVRGQFDNLGDVPRMPPARIGAELRYSTNDWTVYGSVQHARKQTRAGEFELGTDAWTRVDLGADYTLRTSNTGEVLLFVRGHNLTNEEIRLSTSYLRGFAPESGRSLETGIRYTF
jgi:iron complex outermembrane receptor protein